ncbi:MAG TPA: FKBP-type peptidyl-prolyl cis-trans isomerase [Adhaeribacter sp.]|nr:FKBP-type peptidyl-prolyl cis-trans isomerase [Adhaeribacter sp.]
MLKKAKFFVPVLAGVFLMQACQDKKAKDEFTKTEGGLEYKLYGKDKDGKYEPKNAPADTTNTLKVGQVVTMQQIVKNDADSVLFSTYTGGQPAMAMMQPSTFGGSLEEGFAMLEPGDSAVFRVSADTLFAKAYQQPLPPFIKPGSKLTFHVKIDKVQSREEAMADQQKMAAEMQQKMMAQAEEQIKIEDELLKKYAKENNLNVQKTESGIYYAITKKGTGAKAKPGQTVAVHYRGTLLDGKEFDSSAKRGVPIEFPLGAGQVIQGWDEGIAQLNEGAKAVLLIPSPLAYGPQGAGADIPGNTPLRFDVELVDIK